MYIGLRHREYGGELRDSGHVHTAWLKDACGKRMYAICNCCSKCCVAIESLGLSRALHADDPPLIGAPSGYVSSIDAERCQDCGKCMDICSFGAIESDMAGGYRVIDSLCMGCGICGEICPYGAVELLGDGRKETPFFEIL